MLEETLIAPLGGGHKLHQLLRQLVLQPFAACQIVIESDYTVDVLVDSLFLTGRLKPERNHLFQQIRIPQPGHKSGNVIDGYVPVVLPGLLEKPVVILKLVTAQPQGISRFSLIIQKLQVIHHLWYRCS